MSPYAYLPIHLFNSGLINQSLDAVEAFSEKDGGTFAVLATELLPDSHAGMAPTSEALVQVSLTGGRDTVEALLSELRTLAAANPESDATVGEMPWDFCGGNFGATGTAGSAASTSDSTPKGGAVEHALLLGAGLVAAPAAELLSRAPNRIVTVVSSVPGEASALVKRLEGIGRTNVHAETWGREDAANGAKGSRLYNRSVCVRFVLFLPSLRL